jgi:hypothetical protein
LVRQDSRRDDVRVNERVVLSQLSTGRRCVFHHPIDEHGDGDVYFLEVDLEDDGLTVHGWSSLDGQQAQDLPAFLADLVVRWRGWEGTLTWTSMEGEMTLDATHNGHQVTLGVTVRRPHQTHEPDAWSARVVFLVEPGEQLRTLSREASAVLTRDSHDRRSL